jgi:hypothetical protein
MSNQIKERPILFSAPMVRAIQEGRKSVTRRPVKVQPFDLSWSRRDHRFEYTAGRAENGDEVDGLYAYSTRSGGEWSAKCPYGQPGDRLWVRETLHYDCEYGHYFAAGGRHGETVYLCSLFDDDETQTGYSYDGLLPERSVPSIHLHRRYSRILLEITDVRVERLQAISADQAEAEGIEFLRAAPDLDETMTPQQLFECLWDHVNGEGAWDTNPWVWVVEFERVMP